MKDKKEREMKKIMLSVFALVVFIVIAIPTLAAAQTGDENLNSINYTKTKQAPENLESVLYQLVECQNRDDFAEANALYLKDGKVRVIIELNKNNEDLEFNDDIVIETKYENLIQALVPVDNLILLSEDENVGYIRAPLLAYPQETSENQTSYVWLFIGVVIVIAIIASVVYLKKRKVNK